MFFAAISVLTPVVPAFSRPRLPPRPPGFRVPVPVPVPHSRQRVRAGSRHRGVTVRDLGPSYPQPYFRPVVPYGRVIRSLPEAIFSLSVAGALFYYHLGSYYRQTPNGYVVVNAPTGAVVNTLPPGYATVAYNGVNYYAYGGVYYLPHARGYVVVSNPTGGWETPVVISDPTTGMDSSAINVPAAKIIPAQVRVTSTRLNVRSDPNMDSTIISQLSQGTLIRVIGNVAGWYKVLMTDESTGWIKIRFTTPILPANG